MDLKQAAVAFRACAARLNDAQDQVADAERKAKDIRDRTKTLTLDLRSAVMGDEECVVVDAGDGFVVLVEYNGPERTICTIMEVLTSKPEPDLTRKMTDPDQKATHDEGGEDGS